MAISPAPKMDFLGIRDIGARAVSVEPEPRPTHYPLLFGFAKTGPQGPQPIAAGELAFQYHADSFVEDGEYVHCAIVGNNAINKAGNAHFFWRILPRDIGPKSSLRYSIDLLPTMLVEYQRNPDNSLVLDDDGLPIPTGNTISGFKAKHVVKMVTPDTFGLATQSTGSQQDGNGGTSLSFPIFDQEVSHFGKSGDNIGLRMWTRTTRGVDTLDSRLLTEGKFYPFNVALVTRENENSTGRMATTLTGASYVEMSFKPGAKDVNTRTKKYLGKDFLGHYRDLSAVPAQYGPVGRIHVYQENIDAILASVYASEAPYVGSYSDITGTDVGAEKYLINLLTAANSDGTPYYSLQLDYSGDDVVRMSENSTFWARGGSDGTMNEETFNEGIREAMAEFADLNSPLQDMGKYPISCVHDFGLELATKYALMNVLMHRKDIWVSLSTYDVSGTPMTAAEESSMAIALRTRANLFPESMLYGTSVARALIVGRNGVRLNTAYEGRLPLTVEIAEKSAMYMGASDGVWRSQYSFDSGALASVNSFRDINVTWTPETARNRDWANGLIWVQHRSPRELFFPALRTVYADDTSPLNSLFNMAGTVEMIKLGFEAWTFFTGSDKLSNSEFKRDMERWITARAKPSRFDNRFTIIPTVWFTKRNEDEGFSWSYVIRILGANMKVLGQLTVELGRRDDPTATQA